jgi:ribonuclease D
MSVDLINGDINQDWYEHAVAARIVGVDIETSGLSLQTDKIATIQMFVPGKGTVMIRKADQPFTMMKLLENRRITKIFHHAPFDLGFLVRDYDVFPENIADTKVAAKILDPRKTQFIHPNTNKGSHALLSLVHHYFGFLMDKSLAVSDWFAPDLSQEQIEYAAKDVEYLPELLRRLEVELAKKRKVIFTREAMNATALRAILKVKGMEDLYEY